MPLTFNGNTPENVNWNGVALSKVTYNGGVVWEKESELDYVEGYGWLGDMLPNKHNAAQMPISTGESTSTIMACVLRFKLTSKINEGTKLICKLHCGNISSYTVMVKCGVRNVTGDDISNVEYTSLAYGSGVTVESVYWSSTSSNKAIDITSVLSTLRTLYSQGKRTVDILFKCDGSSEPYLSWWLNGELNSDNSPKLYTE